MEDLSSALSDLLDFRLLIISGNVITVGSLFAAIGIIIATIILARIARRGVRRLFERRGVTNEGAIGTTSSLLRYFILVVGFGIALTTLGINLGALFAAGAFFAVALAFALQGIVQNFVSGIILLLEQSIRPGDILDVDGNVVRVDTVGIRATTVRSRDGEDLILPNTLIVEGVVKNYTLQDSFYRMRTIVGVLYSSDMRLVKETLQQAAGTVRTSETDRSPEVFMDQFGDNAVIFEVAVWMTNPWRVRRAHSELNEAIWYALQEQGIVIAFPQLDVHFDAPVTDSFQQFASNPSISSS